MDDGFTTAAVPCCVCGRPIEPNPSGMCIDCLRTETNFTKEIPNQSSVMYCRSCGRYQTSPTNWRKFEPESPELLDLCLARLTGLRDMKVVNANFLYTEPHSRRIRVSLTVQKEALQGTVLRQTLVVTFVVNLMQCPQCCEAATPREHWISCVQVRQDSPHKRTLFWLEQQILSHRAHAGATGIERKDGGVDFHFADKPTGERFVNFLRSRLPVSIVESAKQAGQDIQCGTFDMRFTFRARVPPLNRQDLVVLPPKLVKGTGNQCFVAVVQRVAKKIRMVDPVTAKMIDVDGPTYWQASDTPMFLPVMTLGSLRRFVVVSIDPVGGQTGRFQLADVEITDEDTYEERILVRSHLGGILREGEPCLGYDIRASALPDEVEAVFKKRELPDVILVGRARTNTKKNKKRHWHVKELAPRDESEQEEFNEFLSDLEDDAELRKDIDIYKNEDVNEDDQDVRESAIRLSEMKIDDSGQQYAFLPDM